MNWGEGEEERQNCSFERIEYKEKGHKVETKMTNLIMILGNVEGRRRGDRAELQEGCKEDTGSRMLERLEMWKE